MRMTEEQKLIREYFDFSDAATVKFLAEASDDTQVLSALCNALYDKIVSNVDKIDFGTIPRSRGDITKVDGYENTVECLNIMRKLVLEYKENPSIVDYPLIAINNIRDRKAQFIKAYSTNTEFPMVLYNLMVFSIENTVSFLISVCIQYIKDPETQSIKAALDKVAYHNAKDNLLFEQLAKFNDACAKGEIDTAIYEVYKAAKATKEAQEIEVPAGSSVSITISNAPNPEVNGTDQAPDDLFDGDETPEAIDGCGNPMNVPQPVNGCDVPGGVRQPVEEGILDVVHVGFNVIKFTLQGVKCLLTSVIPLLRSITYFFIHSRVKLSDTLAIQAQFIESNANRLENSDTDMDPDKKKRAIEKQRKIADKLKSWSNKLAIDNKQAERDAKRDSDKEQKQRSEDLGDDGDLF